MCKEKFIHMYMYSYRVPLTKRGKCKRASKSGKIIYIRPAILSVTLSLSRKHTYVPVLKLPIVHEHHIQVHIIRNPASYELLLKEVLQVPFSWKQFRVTL